jgi:3-deoxy-manno-octulosonate cytidylyltransferase (CMP-KDO synthetase)
MSGEFTVVIPARYASSRLPGKPLVEIAGKPMIQHVWERAVQSGARRVVVATDDARVLKAAQRFGADACMTSAEHASGTDRIAEVARSEGWLDEQVIVNLQGDEPLTPPSVLAQVADNLAARPEAEMATLCTPVLGREEFLDPHVVKVVRDHAGYALYFSRAPIPFERDRDLGRDLESGRVLRHLGIYAYRSGFLQRYAKMPHCMLETTERLEQLRALYHGVRIHVDVAQEVPGHGVDTAEDLARVAALVSA